MTRARVNVAHLQGEERTCFVLLERAGKQNGEVGDKNPMAFTTSEEVALT